MYIYLRFSELQKKYFVARFFVENFYLDNFAVEDNI